MGAAACTLPEACDKCGADNLRDTCAIQPLNGWMQSEDLEMTVMGREELKAKLKQIASAEEAKYHAVYAATLARVLDLLTGSLAKVPGSAALVIVAPKREVATLDLDYTDGGQLTQELAGVNVLHESFEKSLSSCAWCYAGEVDQQGRPIESAFVIDHKTGEVTAALAFFQSQSGGFMSADDCMNVVDIASSIGLGVVFSRSKQGIVTVFPAAEVQWSRGFQVEPLTEKGASAGSVELAVMLDNIGSGHLQKGNPAAAKQLHERALRIQEAHFGPNHVQVAVTLDNLGIAHTELGNPEYAKQLLTRALQIHEAHFGRDHVQVAWTLDNFGSALRDLGELRQAQALHERALRIYEAEYGSDAVRLGRTLNSLGHTHRGLGNPGEAKRYYKQALVVHENEIEPDQAQVAICYNNLGNAHRELADVERARNYYENALAIAEAHFGPTHAEVGRTLNNLGLAHLELGDPETAQGEFARALDIFEARFGSRHMLGAMVLVNMATAMAVLEHKKQAKERVLRAEAAVDALGGTACLELELRAAAVRFAIGDKAHPTPQERWNKAEGQIQDLVGPQVLDAVCARCKEGLIRSWEHTSREDVIQWLQARGTARI